MDMLKIVLLWLVAASALRCVAAAQEHPGATSVATENGDLITLGKIIVDKQARTARFPATVNMAEGALEYLLVNDNGKTHESLFATAVSPFQLNIAMLLLGVTPTREVTELPPEQITAESLKNAPELKGDKVDILVSWKQGSQIPAEEWINNLLTKAPAARGPWIYTGSVIYEKRFLAQEVGSIIALATDPAALLNNPREGHTDDTVWSVRTGKVPAVGTPVEITFHVLTPTAFQNKP